MQLVYTMFIVHNHASFHLWWKENLLTHQKVSKYYENDWGSKFFSFNYDRWEKICFWKSCYLFLKAECYAYFLMMMMTMMNYFFGMLDLQIAGSRISRRDNCQEASPSWVPRKARWESIPKGETASRSATTTARHHYLLSSIICVWQE